MNERSIILLCFGAILVREMWLLVPDNGVTFDPFPFHNIQITKQTYLYFACYYASMLMLVYAIWILCDKYQSVIAFWFYLQLIEFVDYWLTYNNPWFVLFGIGVGITIIKFVTLSIFITYKLCKTS